jgi:hypothetical protein
MTTPTRTPVRKAATVSRSRDAQLDDAVEGIKQEWAQTSRIAACDHLVRGNQWKQPDAGRKGDLLPLREPAVLAEGARMAVEMTATRENLQRRVSVKQAEQGRPRQKRGASRQRLTGPRAGK